MTTLNKLQISGIRSYVSNKSETIKFFKPLTIIYGRNGSGKTTIIEALRFVSSGQNPPDSRNGKTFIRDPNLSNEPIVRAQIKLSLRTPSNKNILIIRSFQITQTAKSRRYQHIDGTIRFTNENNEEITVTRKCTEIESIITELMGVSKAILSNVIFCHQDESCWPLGDSKSLKNRFDDIFASSRYSKAVDKLKSIRKSQKTKLMFLEKDKQMRKIDFNMFSQYTTELKETDKEIVELKGNMNILKENSNKNMNLIEKYTKDLRIVSENKSKLENLNYSKNVIQLEYDKLNRELKEKYSTDFIAKTNNELKILYDNLESELKLKVDEKNSVSNLINKHKPKLDEIKLKFENLLKVIGRISSDEERYLNNIELGTKYSIEVKKRYGFKVNDLLNYELCEDVCKQLREKIFSESNKIAQINKIFTQKYEKMSREHNEIMKEFIVINNNIKNKNELLKNINKKVLTTKEEMNKKRIQMKDLANINNDIVKIKDKIITNNSDNIDESIDELKSVLSKEEKKLFDVNEKLNEINKRKSENSLMEFKISNYKNIEKEFNSLFSEFISEIKQKFTDIKIQSPSSYQTYFDTKLKKLECMEKELTDKIEKENLKSGIIKEKILNLLKELNDLIKEKNDSKKYIIDEIGDQDVMKIYKSKKQKLEKIQTEVINPKVKISLYEEFISDIKKEIKCPVCKKMITSKEKKNIMDEIKEKIKSYKKYDNQEKNIEKYTKSLNKIEKLISIVNKLSNVDKSIEKKSGEHTKLSDKKCKIIENLSKLKIKKSEMDKSINHIQTLLNQSKKINNKWLECVNMKKEIPEKYHSVSNKIKSEGDHSLENSDRIKLNELFTKYKEINIKLKNIKNKLEKLNLRKNEKYKKGNEFLNKLSELKLKQKELIHIKNENSRLENEYQLLNNNESKHKKEINRIKEEIPLLKSKKESLENKMKVEKDKFNESNKNLENSLNKLNIDLNELQSLEKIHKAFIKTEVYRNNQKSLFKEVSENKEKYQKIIINEENNHKNLIDIIDKNKENLNQINIILEYRAKKKELNRIVKEMNAINSKIEYLDEDQISKVLNEEIMKNDKVKSLISEAEGRCSAFQDKNKEIRRKLIKYKDAELKYTSLLKELEINKLATKDVDLLQKCLDKALIDFHTIKMREINNILKNYWRLVYKGNEIEDIAIVSTAEVVKNMPKNRSYNYSVIMKQGKVNMEMKGRCSAGQRVLASLLIRLALAETFSLNCGILALDEPTTNLDMHNKLSLAESLNELIIKREKISNFQIVLITHDDEFIEMLKSKEICDQFYKVYKDENGHSIIKSENIL